ncbi:MAG: 7-cyano-7-deazaguanine synthase QueC [Phycisphaeraceae bacterium]|nr:7-cyano-7-deazaguanine synthase QueC [Phycisphaeraceae bacterium]
MSSNRPAAVVLLSGGLDSATTLAIASDEGYDCHALSFSYGQRHEIELAAADRVARQLDVRSHRTVRIDVDGFDDLSTSALTGHQRVPKDRDATQRENGIPSTYVPARNTIFLSYGLALAELIGARDMFIGANAVDYSGYPDCRPAYLSAFERMANLATKAAVEGATIRIHAPLIDWPKTKIIRKGLDLGVDYGQTHSCYDPDPEGRACGRCDSCLIRRDAFAALGMPDPGR